MAITSDRFLTSGMITGSQRGFIDVLIIWLKGFGNVNDEIFWFAVPIINVTLPNFHQCFLDFLYLEGSDCQGVGDDGAR